ncbi:acid phosphatase type 7-like isoform X2 [Cydia strobilella]|uniref:acid phosphatase type 7-like isoform X2 n=1 Tax=Cydia strobilella TaxID=1100964 RepID=UPI0030051EA4
MKLLFLFLVLGAARAYDCPYCQPEQVHIAFGEKPNDIVLTWTTFNDTQGSYATFGKGQLEAQASGYSTLFRDGGKQQREMYIHRVTLPGLDYDTTYVYNVGSDFGMSERFSFHVPPEGNDIQVRAAIYGDLGNKNAHSLPYLQEEAERGNFDLILHVGDFAYDMHDDNARVGDQFMRQIQPIASLVPYMTCPGNHEASNNFSNYRARFSMPGYRGTESMFYSFDLGPVHFVSISTEYYYFLQYGAHMLFEQFSWLQQDLAKANEPKNRGERPWIVLMGHRPMYCSNFDDIDCSFEYTRIGIPFFGLSLSLEPLLKQYGVDVVIWAHEHSYERTWPLYDSKVYNGSLEHPYTNPGAPVHVVTGSAGCQENHSQFNVTRPEWSAFRTPAYGYTRLLAAGAQLHFEQVDVEQGGKVVDTFRIVKDRHGAYHYD